MITRLDQDPIHTFLPITPRRPVWSLRLRVGPKRISLSGHAGLSSEASLRHDIHLPSAPTLLSGRACVRAPCRERTRRGQPGRSRTQNTQTRTSRTRRDAPPHFAENRTPRVRRQIICVRKSTCLLTSRILLLRESSDARRPEVSDGRKLLVAGCRIRILARKRGDSVAPGRQSAQHGLRRVVIACETDQNGLFPNLHDDFAYIHCEVRLVRQVPELGLRQAAHVIRFDHLHASLR